MSETKSTKEERKPYKIEVEEHEKFEGVTTSKITTTLDLAQEVNRLFRSIFHDYEGCTILPDQFGNFGVSLFFKDKGTADPGKIKNVTTVVKQVEKKTDLAARISNFKKANNRVSVYELTTECKEALDEFIRRPNGKNVNWNEHVVETTERAINGGFNIYTKVNNIDLYKILRKIYGNSVDGNYMEYQVSMLRPNPTAQNGASNVNFLISITRLDTKLVEKMYLEMGMVPAQGMFIVRD